MLYLRLIEENLREAGARVLAYCLMTNHVHLILVPEQEDSLAVLLRRVNGRYAQAVNIRKGRCGHLWQARFYSCAMAEEHLWVGMRYVETNPCRAGLVERPEEYRWSSAATHLSGKADRSGILDVAFWQRAGGVETWRELHRRAEPEEEYAALRRCTYAGRPFGGEEFVARLEERFHRRWAAPKQLPKRAFAATVGGASVPDTEF